LKHILLHGLGQTAASWEKTISHMDKGLEIICPNLSAFLHGKEKSYINLYHSFAEYCKGLPEPLNLCGLSLGGIIALHYGIENPNKVNSLVLIGTQFTMPKGLLQLQNIIFRFLPRRLFKPIGLEKSDLINLTRSMMELDFRPGLKTLTCPVERKTRQTKGLRYDSKHRFPRRRWSLSKRPDMK
jgi:pimeloyl-ACP methyl ester carboxylesterase